MGASADMTHCFIQISRPRRKAETTATLDTMFNTAKTLDSKTRVKEMRTDSGVKDTHQLFFLEKLFKSYKGVSGRAQKQAALDKAIDALPDSIITPTMRIKGMLTIQTPAPFLIHLLYIGLDPHQDTPVEILHVILLGFVKYLWRDLVTNQIGKNDSEKKELLATRLSSFDVSALGISPLAGHTLVQYAGSLTGRDFRAIAQAAPFVAYDLVPKDCFETWVALSKLIPLVWQPEIEDIDSHCVSKPPYHNSMQLTFTYRHRTCSTTRSSTFFYVLDAGPFAGLINQNSISFYISRNMYDALAPLSCLRLKPSSHSTQSYAPKVYTLIDTHLLVTSPARSRRETVYATSSAGASSSSILLRATLLQNLPP